MIKTITKAYIRTYTDNGQTTAYVEFVDGRGERGRIEGEPDNAHMQALLKRAEHEGLTVEKERW